MHEKKDISPPNLSLKLIRWLCQPDLVEELQGNLHQYYQEVQNGSFGMIKYWYQVFNYLRPSTFKSLINTSKPMFIFNPILTIRNLYKHRSSTLINIFGFTLGLVSAIFLYFYTHAELSYDSFHEEGDQIYRVIRISEINGESYNIGVTSAPFAEGLKNDFPSSISSTTRAMFRNGLVGYGDKKFFEDDIMFADANFFEFFSFPLLSGNPKTALDGTNSVVLSKAASIKYFGEEDPIGKTLEVDNEYSFIVSGIMDEAPAKSHLEFDMVFSLALYDRFEWFGEWWNNALLTYVHIASSAEAAAVDEQLPAFMDKYFGEDFERMGQRIGLSLEPLQDVYFNKDVRYDYAKHGSISSVRILMLVAFAILFIACFNYVNLSIAQSFLRAKEIGVRKVLGAQKNRLILQFLGESMAILILSILLSVGISELLNPVFNRFFGLDIDLNWLNGTVLQFFSFLSLAILVTSGLYPALLLASFKPVSVLKSAKLSLGKNVSIRKVLVVVQFAISVFLIVATLLITAQTSYFNSKDLGFDREAIVLVDLNNSDIWNKRDRFKEELLANANITSISGLSGEPGGFHDASSFSFAGFEAEFRMRTVFTDIDYLNVFNIQLLDGRNFSEDLITDEVGTMIINESALEALGVESSEIIGKKATMGWDNSERTIVGVAKDFHFSTLKDEIEPLAIMTGTRHRRYAIKVQSTDISNGLLTINEVYDKWAPSFPLSYEFLDQNLAELYENEQKQAKVFSAFAGISIFLACLGIFGLAAYSAEQRQKELGIRKVLGATARNIIGIVSKEFVLLVLIAAILAIPSSWYFISQWLSEFAYRIEIIEHWYIFGVGGVTAVAVALITVTFKTYRAAVSNPTESIRNE